MTLETLLPLSSAVPLALAMSGWIPCLRRALPFLAPASLLPAMAAAALLPDGASCSLLKGHVEAAWIMEPVVRSVLWFTAIGWLLATVFAAGYLRDHPRRAGFSVAMLIALGGNLLLVSAADAVTFYTGFAIMSFASWGLVAFEAHREAFFAARVYLALVVVGELMVFPALVKGAVLAESTYLADIQARWGTDAASQATVWLLFLGFGIKAGMAPFHFWLPVAHPAAPTPASAVLSGCMIKAGLLAWIRLLPVEGPLLPPLALTAFLLGAVNLLGGGLTGLTQRHPKAVLAYTSIQSSGVLLLLLAAILFEPALRPVGLPVITGYAAFHALHKVSLFFAAGVCPGVSGRWMGRAAWMGLIVLAASYAGVPGLAGDLAKSAGKPLYAASSVTQVALPWLLAAGGFLSLLATARAVVLIRPGTGSHAPAAPAFGTWLIASVIAVAWPFAVSGAGFAVTRDPFAWVPLGLAAYLLACWLVRRWPSPVAVPPGDLLRLAIRGDVPRWSVARSRLVRWEAALSGPTGALAVIALLLALLGLLGRGVFR